MSLAQMKNFLLKNHLKGFTLLLFVYFHWGTMITFYL